MDQRDLPGVLILTVLGVALLAVSIAAPQKTLKDRLQGTWTAVSATTILPDGTKAGQYGPNPKGMLIFGRDGRLSFILMASGLPRFASNNRETGTAAENAAVVRGSIAYFGTYTVNEADNSYTAKIEGSTFPNWTGTTQTRTVTIAGNRLTITNPAAPAGGKTGTKWKRAPEAATH